MLRYVEPIHIYKGRHNIVQLSLGVDVSADTITSQIRVKPTSTSPLIAEWTVAFVTDGTDGELVLTLDDAITSLIAETAGFMDVKRFHAGQPLVVFESPIPVNFKETVTS
jgi:hypothetical protein